MQISERAAQALDPVRFYLALTLPSPIQTNGRGKARQNILSQPLVGRGPSEG